MSLAGEIVNKISTALCTCVAQGKYVVAAGMAMKRFFFFAFLHGEANGDHVLARRGGS